MPYRVQLEKFEGPLDLLLFLIRKSEVDIYDIPIAEITKQYLAYLEIIQFLDLENAGEYVLMAATLIRIKAQLLLPKPELEDEEVEDPREELVQRLLEYQSYKEVAGSLSEFESSQRGLYSRGFFEFEYNEDEEPGEALGAGEVTLFNLMAAFVDVMKRIPPITQHEVEHIPATIEDQSDFVLGYLDKHGESPFTEIMAEIKERIILIVTFVAILELVKGKQIILNQSKPFSDIWIRRN
ncbi:segregation/condensation protein A [bacterium]|nr:segregation/condensation protein A [bacterium]